jgi:hypothetical protein
MYAMQLAVLCPDFLAQWGFVHHGLGLSGSEVCCLFVDMDEAVTMSSILAHLLDDFFMASYHAMKTVDWFLSLSLCQNQYSSHIHEMSATEQKGTF